MNPKPIETRLIRIESKLHRLMLGLGMDTEGNPARGSLVLDKALTLRVLGALDLLLDELDAQDKTHEYDEVEQLYNQLCDIKASRWKIS